MALVEINPGLWVRPERVTAIAALCSGEDGKPFTVRITVDGEKTTGWEFKAWDDAVAFAGKIAAAVNSAFTDPSHDDTP